MSNTLKLGNGKWATGKDTLLSFSDTNNNYKPLPFSFSRASSGTVINKDGLIETVGSGEPRIDFKDNTKGSLLLEPERTNSITYSNDLSQTVYNGDLRTNSVYGELGFNGENDAWRYTKANSTDSGLINLTFSGTYTISLFIKKEANKGIKIYNFGDTSQFSTINIENGTYIEGVNTVKIEKFSNDWFRVSQTLTVSNGVWYFYLTDGIGNQIATSVTLQNFQIEQGSYSTSYIPTYGSAVTRVADSTSQTPPSGIIGQTEGTVFLDTKMALQSINNYQLFSINNGGGSDRIRILTATGNRLRFIYQLDGGSTAYSFYNPTDYGSLTSLKIAFTYKSGDIKVYINGVLVDSSTNTFTIAEKLVNIDIATSAGGYNQMFFNDVKLYNTALTDQELQALTQ